MHKLKIREHIFKRQQKKSMLECIIEVTWERMKIMFTRKKLTKAEIYRITFQKNKIIKQDHREYVLFHLLFNYLFIYLFKTNTLLFQHNVWKVNLIIFSMKIEKYLNMYNGKQTLKFYAPKFKHWNYWNMLKYIVLFYW